MPNMPRGRRSPINRAGRLLPGLSGLLRLRGTLPNRRNLQPRTCTHQNPRSTTTTYTYPHPSTTRPAGLATCPYTYLHPPTSPYLARFLLRGRTGARVKERSSYLHPPTPNHGSLHLPTPTPSRLADLKSLWNKTDPSDVSPTRILDTTVQAPTPTYIRG
jgi:hypothetical protein